MGRAGEGWVFYASASGAEVVKKELNKGGLSKWESGRLLDGMGRVLRGETRPNDVKHIEGDIYELRVRGLNRNLRLFFATGAAGPLLLALVFVAKKDQPRVPGAIDQAKARLRDHRARTGN